MKILIVEDEYDKREKIKSEVVCILGETVEILESESLRGGLKSVLTTKSLDLILLDMSMPSFDASDDPGGEDPESFAGIELMSQMKLRGIATPVLIVTQYKNFEKGAVTLEELIERMNSDFSEFFKGTIYYSSSLEGWKKQLRDYFDEEHPELK